MMSPTKNDWLLPHHFVNSSGSEASIDTVSVEHSETAGSLNEEEENTIVKKSIYTKPLTAQQQAAKTSKNKKAREKATKKKQIERLNVPQTVKINEKLSLTIATSREFESDSILIDTRLKEYSSSSSEIEYKNFMYYIRGPNTILYRKVESVAIAEDQLSEALKPIQL